MDKYEFKYIYNRQVVKFSGDSVSQILFRVASYLTNRGETPDLEDIKKKIENQLRVVPQKKRIPRLSEAYHAGMALFRQASGKTVEQKVVDERTKICLNCPKRSQTSLCTACGGLSKATQLLNSIRGLTKNALNINPSLKSDYCGVCGCSLPLLLVTDANYLPKDDPAQDRERPEFCWIRK